MYEELIQTLQLHCEAGKKIGLNGKIWTLLGDVSTAIEALTAQLADLQAENAEKDKRIARVEAERDTANERGEYFREKADEEIKIRLKYGKELERVTAERDAAIKDSVARCCGTCNALTQGVYSGKCMVCALCECVPEDLREYHKKHYFKSLWEWRGAQGEE